MNQEQIKMKVWRTGIFVGWMLVVFLFVLSIKELASISHVGDSAPVDTITVSGTGNAYAIPDVATFSFTVTDTEKAVADAQAKVSDEASSTLAAVYAAGVDEKDVQTISYDINPHYEYQNAVCPQPAVYDTDASSGTSGSASVSSGVMVPAAPVAPPAVTYCPSGKSVLTGYDVSESFSVKLRDLSEAGSLLASLGSAGVSDLNGPDFSVDNPDSVQADARSKAIADAQSKAQELAKELGVSLGAVTSFSEGNGSFPQPVMYAMNAAATGATASMPSVSTGQQEVTDDVTITYDIK